MRKLAYRIGCIGLVLPALAWAVAARADGHAGSEGASAVDAAAPATEQQAPAARPAPATSALGPARRPKAAALTTVPPDDDPSTMHFWGTCGASAAIPLGGGRVAVGSDDDNYLWTYDMVEPEALVVRHADGEIDPTQVLLHKPRTTQNLYKFLQINQHSRRNFSAIEGAAAGPDESYWIGSHARREDGETRPNRRRLFAMKFKTKYGVRLLTPHGRPAIDLAHRMYADDEIKRVGLHNAIMPLYRKLEHLSPDVRGLDVQGLAMAPDGTTLWIALRNPRRGSKAFVVPLENPSDVVQGSVPVFGAPFGLELGGRGISAIQRLEGRGEYLIVSGQLGERTDYQLHRWSGDPTSPPSAGRALPADLNVQSLVVSEDEKRLLLFSDDSEVRIPVESAEVCRAKLDEAGACACARVEGQGPKRFRARWIPLDEPAAGP